MCLPYSLGPIFGVGCEMSLEAGSESDTLESGVKDFWDRTERGLLWETGQQPQAAGAKMVAGPLVQTIWKIPSREGERFPKTLQTEFRTILTTEGMKPELIWFSQ